MLHLLSIWAGGLWIIPLLTSLGCLWFLYLAYRSSKSGSTINPTLGGGEGGNVPIYQTGQFVFACILFVATIGIIIWVNIEK